MNRSRRRPHGLPEWFAVRLVWNEILGGWRTVCGSAPSRINRTPCGPTGADFARRRCFSVYFRGIKRRNKWTFQRYAFGKRTNAKTVLTERTHTFTQRILRVSDAPAAFGRVRAHKIRVNGAAPPLIVIVGPPTVRGGEEEDRRRTYKRKIGHTLRICYICIFFYFFPERFLPIVLVEISSKKTIIQDK